MYEGEVTELSPVETENPVGGFTKTVSHVVIGMKTAKGTKQLKLDPSIYEALQKERVEVGGWQFEYDTLAVYNLVAFEHINHT